MAWTKWQKYGGEPLAFVTGMRRDGTTPNGCNVHIRSINAFLHWAAQPGISLLKIEQTVPASFSADDVGRLLRIKPRRTQVRTHLLVLLLLDTGLRIHEALSLERDDVDFENMLLRVRGKGRKQRLVPFSTELRKRLWTWLSSHNQRLVFATRDGNKLLHRNVMRNVKDMVMRAGVKPPKRLLHSFRHTFATNYLRNGGSVFHLQRALGHSTLDMSRRYANLMTEDLQVMHQKVSLLNRMR